MQCIEFNLEELKLIERNIFGFLWGTKNNDTNRARDRIKRSIMKNEYSKGGLKITDIECMDKSLKLRQYIRASKSSHNIQQIQKYCSEKNGTENCLIQEFGKVTEVESVCKIAQITMNTLTDYTRRMNFGESDVENFTSTIAINQIAMTDINNYLERKKKVFLKCIFKPFGNEGIKTYLDLVTQAETENNRNRSSRLEAIIHAFPKYYRDVANSFNDDSNTRLENVTHIMSVDKTWIPIGDITTKDLQWILKNALQRISDININPKIDLRIENPFEIDFVTFRQHCKNPQLRNIHFRLVHSDFYTYEKMHKFKMTNTPLCPRCGETETARHLLWDCTESKKIWKMYNDILSKQSLGNMGVNEYKDLYKNEQVNVLSTIKMKIIKEFIQIVRPTNWNEMRLTKVIADLKKIEFYNSINLNKINNFNNRWKMFENL